MTNIYIAGPMTGKPNFNFPAFLEAEAVIRKTFKDVGKVFNPARSDMEEFGVGMAHNCPNGSQKEAAKFGVNYRDCMRKDLNWILDEADVIVLLPGWENSRGAQVEKALAELLELRVIILDDDLRIAS